ncbi:MAG: transcriptional repressor [Ardenticatenia bacterium]|nr:MAG: transcriptional repressor [Ardenticatenia bacterium]
MEPSGYLAEALRRAGYKLTAPRKAIIQVLEQEGEHLSSGEVLMLGRQIYPLLSRATVYRTLGLLTDLGLIRPILLKEKDTAQRYVTSEGGHHHLVCSTCGTVFEFERCNADYLAAELAERFDFQIRSHLLEFYGTCHACQMRT